MPPGDRILKTLVNISVVHISGCFSGENASKNMMSMSDKSSSISMMDALILSKEK